MSFRDISDIHMNTAMVTILSLNSNSIFIIPYSSNTASPTNVFLFTHIPTHPFTSQFKGTPASNLKNISSEVTPQEIPAWINCSYQRSDCVGESVLFFFAKEVLVLRKNERNVFIIIIPCCFYH